QAHQAAWKKLLQAPMKSPFREVHVNAIPKDRKTYCLAGETALAHFTNLVDPKAKTLAMTPALFRSVFQSAKSVVKFDEIGNGATLQIWKEDPRVFSLNGYLNPVELFISLQNHPDERVQIELDELLAPYRLTRR